MTRQVLRIGTRGSALALAQSGLMAAALGDMLGAATELVRIRTEGDVNLGPLASIGGTGVFVTAIRAALQAGRVDVVVHSLKDLPTAAADGIALAAVPDRDDPWDVLCARSGMTLADLPHGARVGTGSPRRSAQLLRRRDDLHVVAIRGNVDTRLRLVEDGVLDAVVLAAAGLARLGRTAAVTEVFGPDAMLPAPAQGALALECRAPDLAGAWYADALRALDRPVTRSAVTAERALLGALEAGCTAPVGAYATAKGGTVRLQGAVIAPDGTEEIRGAATGAADDAGAVGVDLAERMLADGATRMLGVPA